MCYNICIYMNMNIITTNYNIIIVTLHFSLADTFINSRPSLVALTVKNLPAMQETHVPSPWVRKIPLEKEMSIHSSILAWRIPWMEDPCGLQSMGSQRVKHN